uniref:2-polyprenylphenol hydroxylase and related flavodoxin oxidoreductases n=1 Tax=uncultured myxobacterium HF0200_01L06 TaxID=723556 RepID=E7C3G8_9BACT|nr:2-polyprenylphenol hydroxylase and related flavodoxin oxidoreductases [uncultured myxobacterium HF0200_01L06]
MAIYRVRQASGEGVDLEILYKVGGRGTALLAAALAGQTIRVVGPLGEPFPDPVERPGARPILVGGGTGIASLFLLAERAVACAASPADVTVVLGAQTEVDLLGCDDFEGLGLTLHCVTEDGSRGQRGRVTDVLAELLGLEGAVVFACGPTAMMQRCSEIADRHSVRCVVSLENTMACGFGVCLGCAAPVGESGYALVCCQGPVFEATGVRWSEMP